MSELAYIGIDVGSTTVKVVVVGAERRILHKVYTRHLSEVRRTVSCCVDELASIGLLDQDSPVTVTVTGSAGIGLAEVVGLPFVQEVVACARAVETFIPDTDVAIELGGEDAKI
ncbi:MAG: hypothetical protein LBR29_04460, partial [Methylobacteriaceae bacterium]|nr:hypothetical protein [Methylobacteriaceae bacterium]